ncbi:MAG TPA: substrate-binding domain-containing protein [Roseiflexaceae bacterium]|nr:substrate-binding domain-containing protein [Roseiflexaceae bacterium]
MAGKQMSRRQFLALTATTGIGALLAACGGTSTPPGGAAPTASGGAAAPPTAAPAGGAAAPPTAAPAGGAAAPTSEAPPAVSTEENVIDWWNGWGGQGGKALDEVAKAFNAENHGFTVVRTTVPSVTEKLLTAIAGGVPPDVETGNVAYAELYSRDAFQPLDDLIDSSKTFKRTDILDTSWNYSKWGGKTFGVPSVESFLRYALIVNVDLVKKAGLDPTKLPETWDEAFEWHKKMTEFDSAGNVKVVGLDPLDAMGGSWGGGDPSFWPIDYGFDYWDANSKTYNLDNPQFIAGLKVIKQFYDHIGAEKMTAFRKTSGTWTSDPTASFPAGVQGMIINGYWTPGELAKTAPDKNFAYGWVPVPAERKGKKIQATGGHNSGIPKGAKKADKAWQFIEFLTTDKAIDIIFNGVGWLGASKSYLDKVDTSKYKGLDWYVKSLKEANDVRGMDVDPIEGFTGTEWTTDREKMTFGQLTPEATAKQMQEALTKELKDRGI